jgi:hypothetical protein
MIILVNVMKPEDGVEDFIAITEYQCYTPSAFR